MSEILSSVEFQMSLLLFVALAGYLIASNINQSAVVGIILTGIAVGPSWLGLVTYTDFVSSLAHLGAVVLLFTVGLHFKLKEITNFKNFLIALIGIIVPWIAGYYLAIYSGFGFGMSPRGEVAMIIALIGLNLDLIKQETYIVLILMSLLTTIFTPLVLRNWLYREKPG